uniref:Uncharacterized protein n=1 Tax=Oryza rufipogon TaxID=4529 RepID=A0A0E0N660_ORYRU
MARVTAVGDGYEYDGVVVGHPVIQFGDGAPPAVVGYPLPKEPPPPPPPATLQRGRPEQRCSSRCGPCEIFTVTILLNLLRAVAATTDSTTDKIQGTASIDAIDLALSVVGMTAADGAHGGAADGGRGRPARTGGRWWTRRRGGRAAAHRPRSLGSRHDSGGRRAGRCGRRWAGVVGADRLAGADEAERRTGGGGEADEANEAGEASGGGEAGGGGESERRTR